MGTVEIINDKKEILISSNFLLYGNCVTEAFRKDIEEEVETMWNAVNGKINLNSIDYLLRFKINCWLFENIKPEDIYQNTNPKNNYFRIEEFHQQHISFVDGLGSNSGYFLVENLYKGSTTAAHEYGHTLGLAHPDDYDIRGQGKPGIMYARGTIVDNIYQYNPDGAPGDSSNGGTMHPMHRNVKQKDVDLLHIQDLAFENNYAVIGNFTNQYHEKQTKP
jgi:hypothetical protein